MDLPFISIGILDIIDILLVALLMYQIFLLIRGTVAINVFIGIFIFYMFWLLVKALNMQLLSTILGQIIGVGVIALIIVFQQEIRRFLLVTVTRYFSNRAFKIEKIFGIKEINKFNYEPLADVCFRFAKSKTGALIVIGRRSELNIYAETGDIINANYSNRLLEAIFYEKAPLHDGAVIIKDNKIYAARCVLPVTDKRNLPSWLGMRHKAALGMSEYTDSVVIVVSEDRGFVSVAIAGVIEKNITRKRLSEILSLELN